MPFQAYNQRHIVLDESLKILFLKITSKKNPLSEITQWVSAQTKSEH
jgi:hypothetical protein